jgi:hypothetical protein
VAAAGGQTTDDGTATAQVGWGRVEAPVRVLSDGDADAGTAAAGGGGSQAVDDSGGAAQVGSETLSAPVRVASDGDGGSSSAGTTDGGQTAAGSDGATQVGSIGADAPVSVLSEDGDEPDTTGGADGAEVVEEVLELGMGVPAGLLDRGIREAAAATGSTTDGTVAAPLIEGAVRFLETSTAALRGVAWEAAGSSSGGDAGAPGSGDLAEPPGSGGIGDTAPLGDGDSLPTGAGVVPAALVDVAGTLPLTGIPAWLLLAAGGWLLAMGLALLLTLSLFRNPGRAMGVGEGPRISSRRFVR